MKKLFPEAADVPQGVANRAVRIIEKHLRLHRVERARDLPEEAKVRLYRDLRLLFESGSGEQKTRSARGFFSRVWEKLEDVLSMSEGCRGQRSIAAFLWPFSGDLPRLSALGWRGACPADE